MSLNTFTKEERLKNPISISQLFKKGTSISRYPIRLVWMTTAADTISLAQATFSVPKRKFKKAVHRNRIKRQIREAYRLNKSIINNALPLYPSNKNIKLLFIYTAKEALPYSKIEKSINQLLLKVNTIEYPL